MKKQLLQESEIRKMMKFANIGTLTDGFVGRLAEAYESEPMEEDDTMAEAFGDEMPPEDELPDEDLGDDMPPEEVDDEMPPEDEMLPEGDLEITQEEAAVLVALGERLAGGLEPEMDSEMDPEMDVEDDLGDPAMEMPPEDDDLVNEVLARVARRLKASK